MEIIDVKQLSDGRYSIVLFDTKVGTPTFTASRAEIRAMVRDLSEQISITKDLVHKIVCPKTNPDQHGTILGILSDSDSVHVVWHEGLNKSYEHIDDLTILN